MQGFKSFGDRTVSIRLAPGFTCIVGPNGAGKSNVIDALCFCLGRVSKKTMRAKNLKDLIFAGTKSLKPATSATVKITFDNIKKEFPMESDELEIERIIKVKGGSTYKINGKTSTREQMLNLLAQGNINPDGSNQFVLQGKIVELTHMNYIERRKFIETLIGLEKYDQMKENTFKELEKADKDLGKFEAIFKEVTSQLKKYEKEKNDALRWKELDEKIKQFNTELIAIKIEKLRTEEEDLEKQMEEIGLLIQDLEQKESRQKEKIEQENLVMSNFEDILNEKNNEKTEIDEEISSLRSELSAKETELKNAKDNIIKLEEKKEKLQSMQELLEDETTYEDLMETVQSAIDKVSEDIEDTHQSEDETDEQIREKESEISLNENEKSELNLEISKFKQDISSLKAEIKLHNKTIKKSKKTLKTNEDELKSLKKEDESIEDALKNAQNELDTINQQIMNLKGQIEEENNVQKELEREITGVEKDKSTEEKKISDFNSKISSIKAQIKMHGERNKSLEKKKLELSEEYERLSGGKEIEQAVLELKKNENAVKEELNALKQQQEEINNKQKLNEHEKNQIELQRRSTENEITDYRTRLSGLQTELGILNKNLKTFSRDKTTLELNLQNHKNEIEKYRLQLEKVQHSEDSVQKRKTTISEEKEKLMEKISIADNDYEGAQTEVDGVLQILGILSQEIGGSIDEVKSDIQNASEKSLNSSITTFRDYIEDLLDVVKPIEEIESSGEKSITPLLIPIIETMKLFTDSFDDSLRDIIYDIREKNDIAVQESTGNFDTLIRDFIDIIENVHISLKRLTINRSTELYNEVEEISQEIQNFLSESAINTAEISKLTVLIDSKTTEMNAIQRNYNELVKKIDESQEKAEKSMEEQKSKNLLLEQTRTRQEEITVKEKGIKNFTDNFWNDIKIINTDIESQTSVLTKIQDDLREVRNIEKLLIEIDEAEDEVKSNLVEIENKNTSISELEKSIDEVKGSINTIKNHIEELKGKKDELWQHRQELDENVDQQNENLKLSTDKFRSLQNVQRIITEIENLTTEIDEAKEKVEENTKTKDVLEENISEIESQISEKQKLIEEKKSEKEELHSRQKELRLFISDLNADLQKYQNRLNEITQMINRAAEILSFEEEIEDIDVYLGELDGDIQSLFETTSKIEESRTLKIEEIQKITEKRDASWEKQKQLRDELSEINARLSGEKANLETSKNRQQSITEKIENLFEQSKQFGTLPPVPPNETEENLIGKIQTATSNKVALEPVNLKAIEYYEEVKERFDEIDMRRHTLQRERKTILDSIERIELEKTRTFMKAYHEINRHFSQIFQKLSPGGSAKMILERPESPFEGGISIEARPRGKKISSLDILSGGEKTLVALSFIFAVQTQFPAPFYILDEIDAALDGPNVHRVSTLIREFADQSQFLVISHREENIMNSEMIYGVSQDDGLTSIFSVDMQVEKARIEE